MFVSIITDCISPNAKGRQEIRYASLLSDVSLNFIEVKPTFSNDADSLEAAGNLIDLLDASCGKEGVIVVNKANRGDTRKHFNGCPFAYFYHKKTLVILTLNHIVESFLRKFNVTSEIYVTDVEQVMSKIADDYNLDQLTLNRIVNSQFRSFDYVPYLADALIRGLDIPSEAQALVEGSMPEGTIWYIDGFGNCKLTSFASGVGSYQTRYGDLACYDRLKDLPKGTTAIYTGSSGLGDRRFLEFATQKGNAAQQYLLKVGDQIIPEQQFDIAAVQ